jgi:adenosylcobinamide kinase / adenosylcobinamide-phosphate guanylyltransferase
MTSKIQLILGGMRSGKSRYALTQGDEPTYTPKIFVATATALDLEMKNRISRHQMERGPEWTTLEEPYYLLRNLKDRMTQSQSLVVMDCSTLWISNLLCGIGGPVLSYSKAETEIKNLVDALPNLKGTLRIVSNEVGLGIISENELSRQFCDLQGRFNQAAAKIAQQVIFMTAGIPFKIK